MTLARDFNLPAGKRFFCECCKRECVSTWTDEQAKEEYENKFGPHMGEQMAIVCDDCHADFMKWYNDVWMKNGNN